MEHLRYFKLYNNVMFGRVVVDCSSVNYVRLIRYSCHVLVSCGFLLQQMIVDTSGRYRDCSNTRQTMCQKLWYKVHFMNGNRL